MNPIFSSLPLTPELLQNLESLGYVQMTPIQEQALPAILAGKDVIAQARTGSGKTAAFGLGLIARLDPEAAGVQALVLCPTRELADQIAREIRRLARCIPNIKLLTLCGGMPLWPQVASLEHPPHIIVGTPGRVLEHLSKNTLQLDTLQTLVLDEADRMLDMGFGEAIAEVIKQTPKQRQTLLFSATYPDEIRKISRSVQRSPATITIEAQPDDIEIEQLFFEMDEARRIETLATLLLTHPTDSAVIFCNTRIDCQDITEQLAKRGFSVIALHGDLEQRDREEALVRFANGSYRLLVATDVAARGLDVKDLPAVINFELPSDADIYTHRIGRTGRAGRTGLALSLCTAREMSRANVIEKQLGAKLRWLPLKPASEVRENPPPAKMITLCVDGGRKEKVRPGDILGALTGAAGLAGTDVGKINTFDLRTYVAVSRKMADKALARLNAGQIKGRNFRVRKLA